MFLQKLNNSTYHVVGVETGLVEATAADVVVIADVVAC